MATQTKLRPLLLRMQAVLLARRVVQAVCDPVTAATVDVRLRMVGAWLVAEMRRLESGEAA